MEPKQVIVVRKDLNMRKGKMCAQVAHASLKSIMDLMGKGELKLSNETEHIYCLKFFDGDPEYIWLNTNYAKIVVSCNSEEELLAIEKQAKEAKLHTTLITDHGRTEFHGVHTPTCLAIGPDFPNKIDPITKHLNLL